LAFEAGYQTGERLSTITALLIEIAVTDFVQPIKEHSLAQRIVRFALIQPSTHTAAQLNALQLV
jgi:hypothetical protein